ncbi:MAG: DUF1592 domain-containing protein [Archangiaceae bacterium]|nr:DUF1592 domain-containing protein [Archangiaceae bacterium]
MPKGSTWSQSEVSSLAALTCRLAGYEAQRCASEVREPGAAPVRRLTRFEYDNTVADLFGLSYGPGTPAPAGTFPNEEEAFGFLNNAEQQTVSQLLADKYLEAAEAVVARVDVAALAACTPAETELACATRFVQSLGRRAFRRPLTASESADYVGLYSGAKPQWGHLRGLQLVAEAMLQSPLFLYRVEVGAAGPEGSVVRLTGFELATRLSYLLLGTTPDRALLDAAERGQLDTDAQVEAQARAMLYDAPGKPRPRARAVVTEFHRQWLQLGRLDSAAKDPSRYPTWPQLQPHLAAETRTFIDAVFWARPSTLALFDASSTYLDRTLAEFYGLPRVTSQPDSAYVEVPLAGTARAGLLTQGHLLAMLASAVETSPIQRGKFVREQLLCQALPLPDPNLMIEPPSPDPTRSTRERFAQHSADPLCAQCHVKMDPIGFGLESFDAVGAARSFDGPHPVDDTGNIVATVDIDGPFKGGVELGARLAKSSEVRDCMALQWFRFAHGRSYGPTDACGFNRLKAGFAASGGDARALLLALTQTDAFLYRRVTTGATP